MILLWVVSFLWIGASEGVITWNIPPPSTNPVNLVGSIENRKDTKTPIYTVNATSGATTPGINGTPPVFYTMTVDPPDGNFVMNSRTGEITHIPIPHFNYEDPDLNTTPPQNHYVFKVTAFSGITGESASTSSDINYQILDVNERPTISNLPACLNVYEDTAGKIWKVDAKDPDNPSGSNSWSKLDYVIDEASKEPKSRAAGWPFDINKKSAGDPREWADLHSSSLSYERQNNYNMSIYVQDQSTKIPTTPGHLIPPKADLRSLNHKVQVQVIDVNDKPYFLTGERNTTCEVKENTPIGTTVQTGIYPFRAYDKDKFPWVNCLNKIPDSVEYFVEGKFSEYFEMKTVNVTGPHHQDGYLIVKKSPKWNDKLQSMKGKFKMYVNARDSRGERNIYGNDVEVECEILDVDDNPTICEDYNLEADLKENTPFDTTVLTVSCSDDDDVSTNPIIYTIKDAAIDKDAKLADQYFHFVPKDPSIVPPVNDVMKTKQRLTLEGGKVLEFKVLATQGAAFSQMSTTLTVRINVIGVNGFKPTWNQDFYYFYFPYNAADNSVIGNVSASDVDQPQSTISYFLVEKAEGIMLGTKSGKLYTDYTNVEEDELKVDHMYWMSARANDNDKPPYYSNHVYIRVNTYDKKKVLINIEVAVGYSDFTSSDLADFEKSLSNICKPCKGLCPETSAKGSNTVVTCFALKDGRTFQKTNKQYPAEYMSQDELIDYLTSEKLVAGNIYGFGTFDIVSVTPYGEGPDLLPLWIVLGILGLIGLICGLAFAIKACISHGLCEKCKSGPKPTKPKKIIHPESHDVDTFNFNYAEHNKGPI